MRSTDSPGLSDREIKNPGGTKSFKTPSTSSPGLRSPLFKLPTFAKLEPPDQVKVLRKLLDERKANRQPGEVNAVGKLQPAFSPLPPREKGQAEAVQKLALKGRL
jgi:hypothetical protein